MCSTSTPEFYRGDLPHLTPIGGRFFVTFSQDDALPQRELERLRRFYHDELNNISNQELSSKEADLLTKAARRHHFRRYEQQLDGQKYGSCKLSNPENAALVVEQILRFDGELYDALAYCVMPNHVHLVLDLGLQIDKLEDKGVHHEEIVAAYKQLGYVMNRIKGASSRYINQRTNSSGKLWRRESYDHWIRPWEPVDNFCRYVWKNPEKAGLVTGGQDWKFRGWKR